MTSHLSDPVISTMIALENKKGQLSAEDVLDEAITETSPLHPFFNWDDAQAARERRLEQARDLIRSFKIVINVTEFEIEVPRYVRDVTVKSHEQGYIETTRISPRNASKTIANEMNYIIGNLSRVRGLASVMEDDLPSEVNDGINNLLSSAKGIMELL